MKDTFGNMPVLLFHLLGCSKSFEVVYQTFHELKFTARKPATANPEILVTVRATVCLGALVPIPVVYH